MKKLALISVSNKENIIDFAKELINQNYEIISTSNTYKLLKENGLNVEEISKYTDFNEILNGKVKTLHPKIFAGILANDKEADEMQKLNFQRIDMIVVNLYPFEEYAKRNIETEELMKQIDIGGVSLLRAGAKNCENITVVSDINDYPEIIKELKEQGKVTLYTKQKLAIKAFELTTKYDALISKTLSKEYKFEQNTEFLSATNKEELRYGENPHQKASLYDLNFKLDYEILNGKQISYNNILDITAALNIVSEFYDVPSCAIIKHTTPCGVALGKDIEDAYLKAFDCDSLSAFGGIVAFSQKVNEKVAKMLSKVFLEVIIAPDFSDEAIEILKTKKNLRVIKLNTPLTQYKNLIKKEYKITPFGLLVQETDKKELDKDNFKVVTKTKPTEEQLQDLIFAWKIVKHTKSNAIVIAKDFKAIGIAGGFTSRVDAVEWSINHAMDGTKDAVLASDGFFPAIDNINVAAQGRISAIIQPGGSIKDKDVIEQADKLKISMITTGIRHFRH